MQEKHAWDKLLTLTGNIEEDFQKVIVLLEEHDITNPLFIKTTPVAFPKEMPKILRSDHTKIIGDYIIQAVFETYLESGQIFLKDAWVITR